VYLLVNKNISATVVIFGQQQITLEAELLGEYDGDHITGGDMPPPSTSSVPNASILPLSSQRPLSRGGHSAAGRVPRTLPPTPTPTPLLQRSREKKLEVSCGKRKT
jgi:hypothetical protein